MKKKAAASKVKKKSAAKKTAKTAGRAKKKTAARSTAKKATRSSTAKKKTAAKKSAGSAKKATAKKTAPKRTAAKKTAVKKTTAKKTAARGAKKTAPPVKRSAAAPEPVSRPVAPMTPHIESRTPSPVASSPQPETPAAPERRPIGVVNHYYSHLGVAVVQLNEEGLRVGDMIHIKGHTTDLTQSVESIEIDHQSVQEASVGQVFGLKVRDHVREHDQIYKAGS